MELIHCAAIFWSLEISKRRYPEASKGGCRLRAGLEFSTHSGSG